MARARGGDNPARRKGAARGHRSRGDRARQVYIFTEGEVTEPEYIDIILEKGDSARPGRRAVRHIQNSSATAKLRKPLPMVKEAVRVLDEVKREAKAAGLRKDVDWNWPQVWVVFDRDDHQGIPEAMKLAKETGVRIAYSHPCFELWRLLHYQNYTSTFGGVCGSANNSLRQQSGFARTYGRNVNSVSESQSKHVQPAQLVRGGGKNRYADAREYAKKINEAHNGGNPNDWDPYTDVWRLVEEGLLLSGY